MIYPILNINLNLKYIVCIQFELRFIIKDVFGCELEFQVFHGFYQQPTLFNHLTEVANNIIGTIVCNGYKC